MTEKFTNGEWTVEEKSARLNCLTWFGFQVISQEKRKRVCYSETDDKKNIPEMQANAALIAAAPKMYNRLKEVKSNFRALLFNQYISEHTKECIEVMIDHIEDDLKKARGEE